MSCPCIPRPCACWWSSERGFTLLEMLVVLVIAGLVTTILFSGLRQVLALDTQLGSEIRAGQRVAMQTDWFRQTVNGLVPVRQQGLERFSGSERVFRGLSLGPLSSADEALMAISWRIDFDRTSGRWQLLYGPDGGAVAVLSWQGGEGRFAYLDSLGERHDHWPPLAGRHSQLPRAILFEFTEAAEGRTIVAAPRGLQEPLPSRRELQD